MDEDLELMTRDQGVAEVQRLRQGIRHRESLDTQLPWAQRTHDESPGGR